jgi:UDP-N-acetylmuramate--alanine ligase
MLAAILVAAGRDPTAFVGGDVLAWGSNYRLGNGPHVVFEADESDGSFREYAGCSEVISCVEADHLDQHGTVERVAEVFADFLAQADPRGFVVWGQDCPRLARLVPKSPARLVSFGSGPGADYGADGIVYAGTDTSFTLLRGGQEAVEVRLRQPGEHNVRNALAAIAAAEACGVAEEAWRGALAGFTGTGRRFELLGRTESLAVYDDYAHHPTAVRVTLAAARQQGFGRVIVVFQPHLYSRTRDLMADFAVAFHDADVVVITGIYGAREQPIPGVSAEELAGRIRRQEPGKAVHHAATKDQARELVAGLARPGDLILSLGAGDVREVGEQLAAELRADRQD